MLSYKKIINELIKRNFSISVAESCSGGQLSSTITKVSGVSKIFNMGLITYSNQAKINLLKVPISKIIKHGAVSKEVALSMVLNLAKLSKSKSSHGHFSHSQISAKDQEEDEEEWYEEEIKEVEDNLETYIFGN